MNKSFFNKSTHKTVLIYLMLSILSVAVDNIYAQFGHGVRSAAMSYMFLYPLLGGSFFYFLLGFVLSRFLVSPQYRLFYNTYNSSIATLTVGSFLKGIFDIAGTASNYVTVFFVIGWLLLAASIILIARWFCFKNTDIN